MAKGKVTGIGGIFFKCADPNKTKDWYKENLGLNTNPYGALFEFRQGAAPEEKGYLQWSPMKADTDYFDPSKREFMVNYRVENIEAFVEQFKESGVTICDEIQSFEYGKFVHIMDPDGNKLELWEPIDSAFTKTEEGKTIM